MPTDARNRVLLVDDDADYLDQLRLRFENLGFQVTTARDEHQARTACADQLPHLAVLDLMMDQVDGGFTLAHWLKSRDPGLPVIMVTGVAAETGLDFAGGGGKRGWIKADAVLAKPVRFEQILRELGKLGLYHE